MWLGLVLIRLVVGVGLQQKRVNPGRKTPLAWRVRAALSVKTLWMTTSTIVVIGASNVTTKKFVNQRRRRTTGGHGKERKKSKELTDNHSLVVI